MAVSVGKAVKVGLGEEVLVGRDVALGWAVRVLATMVAEKEFMVDCTSRVGAGVGTGPQAVNIITIANIIPNCFIKICPFREKSRRFLRDLILVPGLPNDVG